MLGTTYDENTNVSCLAPHTMRTQTNIIFSKWVMLTFCGFQLNTLLNIPNIHNYIVSVLLIITNATTAWQKFPWWCLKLPSYRVNILRLKHDIYIRWQSGPVVCLLQRMKGSKRFFQTLHDTIRYIKRGFHSFCVWVKSCWHHAEFISTIVITTQNLPNMKFKTKYQYHSNVICNKQYIILHCIY